MQTSTTTMTTTTEAEEVKVEDPGPKVCVAHAADNGSGQATEGASADEPKHDDLEPEKCGTEPSTKEHTVIEICHCCRQTVPRDEAKKSLPTIEKKGREMHDESDNTAEPPEKGAFITHTWRYLNPTLDAEIIFNESAREGQIPKRRTEQRSVFELVTVYTAARFHSTFQPLESPPPIIDGCIHLMTIHSTAILQALREVIEYCPGIDLSTIALEIPAPYALLVHHYNELVEYRNKLAPVPATDRIGDNVLLSKSEDPEDDTTKDISVVLDTAEAVIGNDAYTHLTMLLDYLDQNIMVDVIAERKRHEKGFATFDMLWLLFRPGVDVVIANRERRSKSGKVNLDAAVLSEIKGGPVGLRTGRTNWEIKAWNLDYDGEFIRQNSNTTVIYPFDGEIEIAKLEILPIDLAPAWNGIPLRKYLSSQGRKWYSLLKPACRHHFGESLDFPFHHMEGQIMIDREVYDQEKALSSVNFRDPLPALPVTDKFSTYNDILPEFSPDLTDHHYLLCPQSLKAYFFSERKWVEVDVSNVSPHEYSPEMINTLVMDPKRITLLKALSRGYMQGDVEAHRGEVAPRKARWFADHVKGKGRGLNFLLHGPPGVGKTFTAECIAQYTKRPLMTLTCGDIGTTASAVEQNLEKYFSRARKWGAILLIDEADIYLERRHQTDLERNALVASFLRALETYEGVLFLTTNRVGAFDDAFISRIHFKLHCTSLSDDDRERIWDNFINKLENERGEEMVFTSSAHNYIQSKKIQSMKLNGREIRNIFQTAVGLAEFEPDRDKSGKIKVKKDHLAQVAEMSTEFKDYLDEVLGEAEPQRAERAYLRLDSHGQEEDAINKRAKKRDADADEEEEDDG